MKIPTQVGFFNIKDHLKYNSDKKVYPKKQCGYATKEENINQKLLKTKFAHKTQILVDEKREIIKISLFLNDTTFSIKKARELFMTWIRIHFFLGGSRIRIGIKIKWILSTSKKECFKKQLTWKQTIIDLIKNQWCMQFTEFIRCEFPLWLMLEIFCSMFLRLCIDGAWRNTTKGIISELWCRIFNV